MNNSLPKFIHFIHYKNLLTISNILKNQKNDFLCTYFFPIDILSVISI